MNATELAERMSFVSLAGMSLSLMNGASEEVAHVTLTESAALWEIQVKHRWRGISMELAALLEDKWQNNETDVQLEEYLQVSCGFPQKFVRSC